MIIAKATPTASDRPGTHYLRRVIAGALKSAAGFNLAKKKGDCSVMYFVDRELLEKRLVYLEDNMKVFSESKEWVTDVEKAALERICHMIIETITDTGNQMIDGFIMRDPGSYNDIVDILVDEKVISRSEGDSVKRVFRWRKTLLQEYTDINHQELHESMLEESTALLNYPGKVRRYIENELGPVSAFLPQKD